MVHFGVFFPRWIGSDSLRKTSIKRREMLRSFRLCPLVRLPSQGDALYGKVSFWFLSVLKPPELFTPGFNTFGGFEFPYFHKLTWAEMFSCPIFLSFFSPPLSSGCLSPSSRLRRWCRSLRRPHGWIAAAGKTTRHFQSVSGPPEATAPPSVSPSPCFHLLSLPFLCCFCAPPPPHFQSTYLIVLLPNEPVAAVFPGPAWVIRVIAIGSRFTQPTHSGHFNACVCVCGATGDYFRALKQKCVLK